MTNEHLYILQFQLTIDKIFYIFILKCCKHYDFSNWKLLHASSKNKGIVLYT